MTDMRTKYGQSPFDPNDPNDVMAEAARQAILDAMTQIVLAGDFAQNRSKEYLLSGMLIGVVHTMQAVLAEGDATDAAIRASIIQVAPWAVDAARAFDAKAPLSDC